MGIKDNMDGMDKTSREKSDAADWGQEISHRIKQLVGDRLAKLDKLLDDGGSIQIYRATQQVLGNNNEEVQEFTVMELSKLPFVFKGSSFVDCFNKLIMFIDTAGQRQLKKFSDINGE